MRVIVTITLLIVALASNAQTKTVDCRDPNILFERLWKHDIGSASWKLVNDSVLNICPNNARLWGNTGMAYMLRGEFIEGMRFISKAAKLDPFYFLGSRAWYRMHYLHDYEGAIKDLDTLETIAGSSFVYVTNVHMYIYKGLAYQELGDKRKALELYDIAINEQVKTKGDQWVGTYDYLYRGILRYRTGDMDGAISDLTRQVKEYETLADTYYYRGLAYAAVGRKDEARVDILRAKDLMLGEGQRRWDDTFVLPDEIFLSDVENALLKLY